MKISLFVFALILCSAKNSIAQQTPLRMWFNEPAGYWEAGLPLGNGRLGAMPDGGIIKENISLVVSERQEREITNIFMRKTKQMKSLLTYASDNFSISKVIYYYTYKLSFEILTKAVDSNLYTTSIRWDLRKRSIQA